MALYRKYRPATFAEVVGQQHVTEPLSTALDAGRINHAYLFSGPRGCGKTSSARILARSLNCVEGPTSRPCGKCVSCVALAPGGPGNLDVIELDAASHGGVDDTRDLRDRASYAPAESRYRVFIIDEAHMVTSAGFNALLKTVEEPPEHLIFVFATTEPDKVLPTIRSRTHHYPFRLLPPSTMRGLLESICAQEDVHIETAVYPLVIRAGGGSPRDSLSVLDQLIAGAGPEGVTYPRALALLGVTDVALIDEAVDALAADDGGALFTTIDKVMEAGHDPRRFAVDLLDRLRDLILLRAVPDAGAKGLVEAPGDLLDRMQAEADRIGPATLARYAELVHEGLGEMRGATAPRLLLEVTCARMLLPSASDAESAALQRIERLERRLDVTRPSDERAADPVPARRRGPAVREESARAAVEPPARTPADRPEQPLRARRTDTSPEAPAVCEPDASTRAAQPSRELDVATRPAARTDTSPEEQAVREPDAATPTAEPPRVEPTEVARRAREPEAQPREPEQHPQTPPEPGVPGQPDAAAVRAVWSEVLAKVRERSRTVEVMLSGATVSAIAGNAIVLHHDSGPLAKRLVEPRNADVLREALRDVFGVDWEVRCEAGSGPTAPAAPPRRSAPTKQPKQPKQPKPEGPKFSRPSRVRPAPPDQSEPPRRSAPRNDGPPPEDFPPPDEPPPPDDEPPYDAGRSEGRNKAARPDNAAPPSYDDGPPPPPTADEEEEMLAEAAQPVPAEERRDPDEVALELLQNELGAKPID